MKHKHIKSTHAVQLIWEWDTINILIYNSLCTLTNRAVSELGSQVQFLGHLELQFSSSSFQGLNELSYNSVQFH